MRRSLLCLITLIGAALPALAQGRTGAYIYGRFRYAVPCPAPYVPEGVLVLARTGAGALSYPQDLAVDREGNLYITDSDDPRLVKLSPAGELLLEIRDPAMSKPGGIWVDTPDGSILVTDTATGAILRFDAAGRLLRSYPPPTSEVLPEDYLYSPTRVAQDSRGWLSVIGTGSSGGILLLDTEGVFRGFFGANPARADPIRTLLRRLMSEEQKRAQRLQVLQPYADLDLDPEGFLVTVTETLLTDQIRRLNPLGLNTFAAGAYGEWSAAAGANILQNPRLATVATDRRGIVTVADRLTGKLYQYGREGELLFIWGGVGRVAGTFQGITAIALDRDRDLLYVLDGAGGTVQALRPTAFGDLVHQGSLLYSDGRYEEALETWMEVRELDANYPLAERGVAKVLLRLGTSAGRRDYLIAAMERSRSAGDPVGFSDAFQAHRRLWIQANMPFLVVGALVLFVLIIVASRRRRMTHRSTHPFRVDRAVTHPFQVMEEIKWGSPREYLLPSAVIIAAATAARLIELGFTSYHLAGWDPAQVSLVAHAGRLILPWLTWCGANYLVTAIFRGEGTVGRIVAASAYALVPYVLMTVLLTALSHILSLQEVGLYRGLTVAALVWSGLLFLLGAGTIHGYGAGATLGTSLLSVVGVVALWAVTLLILGLVGTALGFVVDVAREVIFRG